MTIWAVALPQAEAHAAGQAIKRLNITESGICKPLLFCVTHFAHTHAHSHTWSKSRVVGPCLRMRWHFWKGWSGKKWGLVCEPSHTECLRRTFVVWRVTVMVLECVNGWALLRETECLSRLTADAEYRVREQLFHVWKKKYPQSTGHNYTLKWTIIISVIFVEKQHK